MRRVILRVGRVLCCYTIRCVLLHHAKRRVLLVPRFPPSTPPQATHLRRAPPTHHNNPHTNARTCGARPVPATTAHPPTHPGASCGGSWVGRAPAARAPYPPRQPTHRCAQARRVVVPGQGAHLRRAPHTHHDTPPTDAPRRVVCHVTFAKKVDFFATFSPQNQLFPGTKRPPRPFKYIEKTTFPRPFTQY